MIVLESLFWFILPHIILAVLCFFFLFFFWLCIGISTDMSATFCLQFLPLLLSLVLVFFSKGMPSIIKERIIPLVIQIGVISIFQFVFLIMEKFH